MDCISATGQVDLMTPAEVDFSMGWPSLPFAQEYTQHMPRVMQSLTFTQAASLAGNGMHLAVLGCWWTFIAMHTVRRDSIVIKTRVLTVRASDDAEEADDEFDFS